MGPAGLKPLRKLRLILAEDSSCFQRSRKHPTAYGKAIKALDTE